MQIAPIVNRSSLDPTKNAPPGERHIAGYGLTAEQEKAMQVKNTMTLGPQLNERESAKLAEAVQKLVKELGFPHEEINRSYQESYEYFLKQS